MTDTVYSDPLFKPTIGKKRVSQQPAKRRRMAECDAAAIRRAAGVVSASSNLLAEAGAQTDFQTCVEFGCKRPVQVKSMCRQHYNSCRYRATREGLSTAPRGPVVCGVEDCDKIARARDLCKLHYDRWYRRNGRKRSSAYYRKKK